MLKRLPLRHCLLLFLLAVASLFFVGGPDHTALPVIRYAWNLGHIAFFIVVTATYAQFRPFKSTFQVLGYLGAILIISLIIETLQSRLARSMSAMDILRNLSGCTIGLWFVARSFLPVSVLSLLSLILAIDIGGFATTGYTDYLIQTRKPILEDFESALTTNRWHGNLEQSQEHALEGKHSGKATFLLSEKTTLRLESALLNWKGFEYLELNFFNPQSETLTLIINIYDIQHARSPAKEADDRYYKMTTLEPGPNRISIPLQEIESSPARREMNLNKMAGMWFYLSQASQTNTVFLDQFTLK